MQLSTKSLSDLSQKCVKLLQKDGNLIEINLIDNPDYPGANPLLRL